jgi:hypothetical protein
LIFHDFDYVGFETNSNQRNTGSNTLQERVGMIDRDLYFENAQVKSKRKKKIVTPRQIKLKQLVPPLGKVRSKGIMLPEINFRV